MSFSLLSTRFSIPHPRPDLVPRRRLEQKLIEGISQPVTLVSAPAGFGKTTLLSEWVHSARSGNLSVAWLSLEKEDNDPGRFLVHLFASLQTALCAGQPVEAVIQEGFHPFYQLQKLLNQFEPTETPLILILEDYHVITTGSVHEMVTFLVEHMPVEMRLILSTRSDPPLPLARWRLQDQLLEIRTDDLRFTRDEVEAFLRQSTGTTFPDETVTTMELRTEGWIAGLKLVVLSLRSLPQADASNFIDNLRGSHRLIADYLLEEVIDGQSESVRSFLLQTSILPSLTGTLCDAVTGQRNGQTMLEQLERDNLFIVRLDDERVWYRYHHLFTDLLQQKLEQRYPGQTAVLRRRAAQWYLQNDYTECAVDEALEIRDFRLAAEWIDRFRASYVVNGQLEKVRGWVKALPTDVLSDFPRLDDLSRSMQDNRLTQREKDVLRRIAAGASNQEIADNLVISLGTVKKHLNNIFIKLEARNRTQALARARELGWLSQD